MSAHATPSCRALRLHRTPACSSLHLFHPLPLLLPDRRSPPATFLPPFLSFLIPTSPSPPLPLFPSPVLVHPTDTPVTSLEREYKAEVEHSRSLQASKASGSGSGSSAAAAQPSAASLSIPEEAEKDQQAIRLYEDLTDLNISNVKVRPAKHGKEVVFNCVQTVDKRSERLFCFSQLSHRDGPYAPDLRSRCQSCFAILRFPHWSRSIVVVRAACAHRPTSLLRHASIFAPRASFSPSIAPLQPLLSCLG